MDVSAAKAKATFAIFVIPAAAWASVLNARCEPIKIRALFIDVADLHCLALRAGHRELRSRS